MTNIDQLYQYLNSFQKLPDGWYYGSSGPIELETIGTAKTIIEFIQDNLDINEFNVFPGEGRQIMVSAYDIEREYVLDVIVEANGSFDVIMDDYHQYYENRLPERKDLSTYAENLTNNIEEVKKYIKEEFPNYVKWRENLREEERSMAEHRDMLHDSML